MVLIAATLEQQLRRFMDPDFSGFIADDMSLFPQPEREDRMAAFVQRLATDPSFAAGLWTDAYDAYCSLATVVAPPTNAPAAKAAMLAAMTGAIAAKGIVPQPFEAAFLAYTSALVFAGHSAPAPGTPIPPTGPSMAALLALHPGPPPGKPASPADAASKLALHLDLWTKTNARVNDISGAPVAFV